ncbi:unnamed protein product [Triticum turgidum subsp. durum]|uniref:Uncharacterized protein n=1 Tax=Triticum turgidum subsp. durum TaxID=4567 RepID=A0A9R0RKL0_TRITD|nr:unnamed protein product [Triticum turgidum subsp. durum]
MASSSPGRCSLIRHRPGRRTSPRCLLLSRPGSPLLAPLVTSPPHHPSCARIRATPSLPPPRTSGDLPRQGLGKSLDALSDSSRPASSTSTPSSSSNLHDYIRCGFWQVPGGHNYAKFHDELSTASTFVPLPSPWIRQVPLQQVYLYRVFGIAKNVKHPFEMTRPTSSNDPKYLSKNETYTATVARIETDKSEEASTTLNHVRRPSPKTHVTQTSSSTTIA